MTVSAPASPAFDIFSLVSCEDVKAHLTLLRAFHDLKSNSGDDASWRKRVTNSVAKFQTWASQLQPTEPSYLPIDLDVLMVWHTYLLASIALFELENPVKYQHDAAQFYPSLLQLDFAEVVAEMARGSLTPQASGEEIALAAAIPATAKLSDLEDAVQRQASFIGKVVRLGWVETATDEFSTSCIHRYGCFLELMKTGSVHSLVPTLVTTFHKQTKELLGHVLNHDDSIPDAQLSKSFDETTIAWKVRSRLNLGPLTLPNVHSMSQENQKPSMGHLVAGAGVMENVVPVAP
ncbi:hypothetical protein FRC04_007909 [Tulasnella sp. 424]|nr:hypothetical protein FRC04_007909 [Tulasnella sp. 424]